MIKVCNPSLQEKEGLKKRNSCLDEVQAKLLEERKEINFRRNKIATSKLVCKCTYPPRANSPCTLSCSPLGSERRWRSDASPQVGGEGPGGGVLTSVGGGECMPAITADLGCM